MNISGINPNTIYPSSLNGSSDSPDSQIQALEQKLKQLTNEKKEAVKEHNEKKAEELEKKIQEIKRQIEQLQKKENDKEDDMTKEPSSDHFLNYLA